MAFNEPRHSADDPEVISYEALVAGKPVLIAINRKTIEDHLGLESSTPEERLMFVNRSLGLLTHLAFVKLKGTPDATGITLESKDLTARN